jgi:hypothetical protein
MRLTSDEPGMREALEGLDYYGDLSASREECEQIRALAAADIVQDCVGVVGLEEVFGDRCPSWTDDPVPALTPRTVSQEQVLRLLRCELSKIA